MYAQLLHCNAQVTCEQEVSWLDPCPYPTLTEDDIEDWIETGEVHIMYIIVNRLYDEMVEYTRCRVRMSVFR